MEQMNRILKEISKAVIGKEDVTRRIMRAILADGHILLDDVPGVGKTTLAMAISKAVGFQFRRIQCTPDVMPSDIVGFSVYDRESEKLIYQPGAAIGANLLLCDEINRTSSKTQSALLETMEERQVTVDGITHPLPSPFLVIATQNRIGTTGTQLLPYAQMDRFMTRLTLGQPDHESLMKILRDRQSGDPLAQVQCVASCSDILRMRSEVQQVTVKDSILDYIARLTLATQDHPALEVGISPRGALFLNHAAKANAWMDGRDYVTGTDIQQVFADVCMHRVILRRMSAQQQNTAQLLSDLLASVEVPDRRI